MSRLIGFIVGLPIGLIIGIGIGMLLLLHGSTRNLSEHAQTHKHTRPTRLRVSRRKQAGT